MTTTRIQRCEHCKTVYSYHPSVYGHVEFNDERYCPSCTQIIENTLKTIPVKFRKQFIPSIDYTRENLINAQNIRCKTVSTRRLIIPLFDLQDSTNTQDTVCEMMEDPVTKKMVYYSATWWSKTPNYVEVNKEVWWDIENNCVAKDQESYRG